MTTIDVGLAATYGLIPTRTWIGGLGGDAIARRPAAPLPQRLLGRRASHFGRSESCHDSEMFPRGASRMPDGRTLLFSEPSLFDQLQARLRAVAGIVDGWDADDLLGRTDDSLVEQIVEHQRVDPIEL